MNNRLFVGNLSYTTMEEQLRAAFEAFGEVTSASVVLDRVTGQSRGFGFVEFAAADTADKAIQALDGSELDGRAITVNVARERSGGGGRSFAGGRGDGGGGGGPGGGAGRNRRRGPGRERRGGGGGGGGDDRW